jgi:hypothetical protein
MESVSCYQMYTHVRENIVNMKSKRIINGFFFCFDTEEKLDVLCRLLGKNVVFGIRKRPPKLGTSYSVRQNDAMNVVIGDAGGNTETGRRTAHRGIDLMFNSPFLDIYVRSKMYVVGSNEPVPTAKLQNQLAAILDASTGNNSTFRLSDIRLKPKQRFQVENSVYRIQDIVGDEVHAVCVFGPSRGEISQFSKGYVISAVYNRLNG